MDSLLALLNALAPQHWLVIGLILLIAEMASGTTYLLWPAVAAFLTALVSFFGFTNWVAEVAIFGVLIIALTYFGHPLVKRWRSEQAAAGLNERSAALVGARGVVTSFADGVGAVKIGDTVWRAVSDQTLAAGDTVVIDAVDGATLRVQRA